MLHGLYDIHDLFPDRRPISPFDIVLAPTLILFTILALSAPYTPPWQLFRRGIAFPLILYGWVYLAWTPIIEQPDGQWGLTALLREWLIRRSAMLD